jgi:hypothetical protein
MAAVIIKPAPKLGWPIQELAEAMVWEAKSNQVTYASDTAELFSLPENCEIVAMAFRIDTAYDGDLLSAVVTDGTHDLWHLSRSAFSDSENVPFRFFGIPYSSGATISMDMSSASAAGAYTAILLYRLNSEKQDWVAGSFR